MPRLPFPLVLPEQLQLRATPEAPQIRRVKLAGYLFAIVLAGPGMVLLLLELLRHGAYGHAAAHASVMVGAITLFPVVRRRPELMVRAEHAFSSLLVLSALSFLLLYARQPELVLDHNLLGSVLLFIAAGLLLILPSHLSIPVSVALFGAYWTEVTLLTALPPQELRLSLWVNAGMFTLLLVGVVMRQTLASMAGQLTLLEELSARDALTGLLNRRGFEAQVLGLRTTEPGGALIVLDIDHFKPVNDVYGHAEGDRILSELGTLLLGAGHSGVAARWGGEEFVVYLPHAALDDACAWAEALRADVAAQPLGSRHLHITVSVGVSEWRPGATLHQAFLRADHALYAAKRAGRNRVVSEPLGAQPVAAAGVSLPSSG